MHILAGNSTSANTSAGANSASASSSKAGGSGASTFEPLRCLKCDSSGGGGDARSGPRFRSLRALGEHVKSAHAGLHEALVQSGLGLDSGPGGSQAQALADVSSSSSSATQRLPAFASYVCPLCSFDLEHRIRSAYPVLSSLDQLHEHLCTLTYCFSSLFRIRTCVLFTFK